MTGGTGTAPGRAHPRAGAAGAGTAPHTSVLELAPLPSATPCARLHTIAVLHEWGLRHLASDAALIVSELVTNAADASIVLPGHPPLTLRLLATAQALIIEVGDHSPGDLAPLTPSDTAECGRGLTVVAALSTRWGSERTSRHHKTVWAELPR